MGKKQKNQQPPPENPPEPADLDSEKIVQFVLYEFDANSNPKEENPECDDMLAEELYVSFNNYFTMQECKRALDLSLNDIS